GRRAGAAAPSGNPCRRSRRAGWAWECRSWRLRSDGGAPVQRRMQTLLWIEPEIQRQAQRLRRGGGERQAQPGVARVRQLLAPEALAEAGEIGVGEAGRGVVDGKSPRVDAQ